MDENVRKALQTEYYKLIDIIHKYDDYFIRIKTWSISLGALTTGVSINIKSVYTFLLVTLLGIAFWLTEVSFKLVQLSHFKRINELENALNTGIEKEKDFPTPRIIQAYSERKKENDRTGLWKKAIWWNHVMFPHIIFSLSGIIGFIVIIIQKIFKISE